MDESAVEQEALQRLGGAGWVCKPPFVYHNETGVLDEKGKTDRQNRQIHIFYFNLR
jgi:hypothetical protein